MTRFAPLLATLLLIASATGFAQAPLQALEEVLSTGDLQEARRLLSRLKSAGAEPDVVSFFEGRLAFEEGDYAAAVEQLRRAGVEDSAGSYLKLAQDTLAITKKHERAESEHFVFSYPKGKDALLAPYALETLEKIRSALGEDLGHLPEGKIRVEVVNDARELALTSTLTYEQIRRTGTIAICKFNKLIITSPKSVLRGYDWRDTLAHEYVHWVVTAATQNAAPIWLQEGLAKYLESRWRGEAGLSMPPATLALLGERVRRNALVTFEQMHPSIALLPSHEDAAVAFAEVFFAADWLYRKHGTTRLRAILTALREGKTDQQAIAASTGAPFAAFEKSWLGHLRRLPFPKEFISLREDTVTLVEPGRGSKQARGEGRHQNDWLDFSEMREIDARKSAHLGELLRTRRRLAAAAEEFGKAHRLVGDRYPALSNKYALTLLGLSRLSEAETVLRGSLRTHPNTPLTQVHLGRISLAKGDYPRAKVAYLEALSADPFDPEIHVALLRAAIELRDVELERRARQAGSLLLGASNERLTQLAKSLGQHATLTEPSGGAVLDKAHAPEKSR
ncbi:MAG: peptidase MA family metallohydrolase [Myxococcaceae bacterium]